MGDDLLYVEDILSAPRMISVMGRHCWVHWTCARCGWIAASNRTEEPDSFSEQAATKHACRTDGH